MPALVNINVGSLRGTSELEATISWPFLAKNCRKLDRISLTPLIFGKSPGLEEEVLKPSNAWRGEGKPARCAARGDGSSRERLGDPRAMRRRPGLPFRRKARGIGARPAAKGASRTVSRRGRADQESARPRARRPRRRQTVLRRSDALLKGGRARPAGRFRRRRLRLRRDRTLSRMRSAIRPAFSRIAFSMRSAISGLAFR